MKTYKFYLDAATELLNKSLSSKLQEKEYNEFASTLLYWIAIESYINAVCSTLVSSPRLKKHELAFLNESELKVNEDGVFQEVSIRPSTTKKILFLIEYFTGESVSKFKLRTIWKDLKDFEDMRNKIVHHKDTREITIGKKRLERYEQTSKEIIKLMNKMIFKKR